MPLLRRPPRKKKQLDEAEITSLPPSEVAMLRSDEIDKVVNNSALGNN